MASDLSARLRDAYVDTKHGPSFRLSLDPIDLLAAADLIDQQAAEIERLRNIVVQFRDHYPMGINTWLDDVYRAALKERPRG